MAKKEVLASQNAEKNAANTAASGNTSNEEVMTKEELIKELVKSKVNELRLKKGYTVEGAGAEKVFVPLNNKNIK